MQHQLIDDIEQLQMKSGFPEEIRFERALNKGFGLPQQNKLEAAASQI